MEHARLEYSCPPAAKIESIKINIHRKSCACEEFNDEFHENGSECSEWHKPESEGKPLDPDTRALMESRFGHDFNKVRIHTDDRSSQLAAHIGASAFTIRQDIYFGHGQYRPSLPSGQTLLAHELAHTLQQDGSPANHSNRILGSSDPLEAEAHNVASAFSLGFPVGNDMISAAGPAAIGAIGRQTMARHSTILKSPDQDPEIIKFIARGILRSLQVDPDDKAGIVRRQLARISPSARSGAMQIVQSRVSSAEWERLSSVLAEPLPGMEARAPEEPSEEAVDLKKKEEEEKPEVSEKKKEKEPEIEPEVNIGPKVEAEVGAKEPGKGAIEPGKEAEKLNIGEEDAKAIAPERPEVSGAEAASTSAAAPEAAVETGKPIASTKSASSVLAVPAVEAPEASPVPEEETVIPAETKAKPKTETEASEAKAEEPSEPAAELEEAGPETAEGEEEIQKPDQFSKVRETPEETPAILPESSPVPEVETSPTSESRIGQEAAPETSPEPATGQPVEAPESAPESAPETGPEETSEPLTSSGPAEVEVPSGAMAEQEAEQGGGAAPEESALTGTLETSGQETESGAAAAPVEASSQPLASTESQEPMGTAAPSESPAGPEADQAGGEEGGCVPSSEGAPSAEGGEAGGGSCGGGGGGGAEAKPAEAIPDVSQSEPVQAMASVENLPPAQLQSALGSVSAAASRSVSQKKDELAANPPQMERPSGVPAGKDVSQPIPHKESPPGPAGPEHIERAPEGESKPTPNPEPLPPEPALPTIAVSTLGLQGDAQPSEADAAKMQAAVKNLPVTDPALNIRAGDQPKLALEGDADPGRAQAQKALADQGMTDVDAQGKRDAAGPLGESEIYPTVPKETLKAQTSEGGGGGKAIAAAKSSGAGEGSDEASSIIAQEKKGDEIKAAIAKAKGDMAAKQEDHASKVMEEKAKSQQEMDKLVESNATEQASERSKAGIESKKLRAEWSEKQDSLVGDARKDAAAKVESANAKIAVQQAAANSEAANHIQTGNKEAEAEQRKAEANAASERRKAEEQTSGGFLSWLAGKFSSFFNSIKESIKAGFEAARKKVRESIEWFKKRAVEAIEKARQAAVEAVKWAGDALIDLSDNVLSKFPQLRDKFKKAIKDKVAEAEEFVNKLADKLKAGVQKLLDLLGSALNGILGLLESGLLAAVDAVNSVVQGAINFAKSVVQGFADFAVLIKDIAGNPGQWLSNLGRAAIDGVRNCLWGAFKSAIKNWFNEKLEEVLGLGIAIWKMIKSGCLSLAKVGKMAWEGLKAAIPMVLISLLIEKLVSLIIPAGGAAALIMTIIEGLRAAWGTVSRVLQAFSLFMVFLKAVKSGTAAGPFARTVAAAAIVVIDFVANWLLLRLRKPAGVISGRIKALAQKIGKALKRGVAAVKKGAKSVGGAIKKGMTAVGRGVKRGAKAAGRDLVKVGRVIAVSKIFKKIKASKLGKAVSKVIGKTKKAYQKTKAKINAWREKRKRDRKAREDERRKRAFEASRTTFASLLKKGASLLRIRLTAAKLWIRHRFKTVKINATDSEVAVEASFNPTQQLAEARRDTISKAVEKAKKEGYYDVVAVRLLTTDSRSIRDLMDSNQQSGMRRIIRSGLKGSNRPYGNKEVNQIADYVFSPKFMAISGTRLVRVLYNDLYRKAFREAEDPIHHLVPLVLTGSHEPEINLLELGLDQLGNNLHHQIHALFNAFLMEKGLHPATLRAKHLVDDRWTIAKIKENGKIDYEEVVFST